MGSTRKRRYIKKLTPIPYFFYSSFGSNRIKPLPKAVEMTGGVEKFEEVMYGDHLLGKIARNFYGGAREDEVERGQT